MYLEEQSRTDHFTTSFHKSDASRRYKLRDGRSKNIGSNVRTFSVNFKNTVYQRTPDIAIDLSRKLGRGALRGQFLFYYFSYKIKVGLSNMENTSLIH